MTDHTIADTAWGQCLRQADTDPTAKAVTDHVLAVHERHAGFTETCAGQARNRAGLNTYEWLASAISPQKDDSVLDLGCGSGALLALCAERWGKTAKLIGVDMSAEELALAQARLPAGKAQLHKAMAQSLDFVPTQGVTAILSHWALTLMTPLGPVLDEISRIIAPGGVFSAIVDGPAELAEGYAAVNALITKWVRREHPAYGQHELGDPRVRAPHTLLGLAVEAFPHAVPTIATDVFSLRDTDAARLADTAAGFFYANMMLSPAARADMLAELTAFFRSNAVDGHCQFNLPAARLVVQMQAA